MTMSQTCGLDICFMIKSYKRDLSYVEKLISSLNKFNSDSIETFIVIPRADFKLFKKFSSSIMHIVFEEDIPTELASTEYLQHRPGYMNQAIIKLAFHRLNFSEHYLCLDSDFEFLRAFRKSDFLTNEGTPYTVLVEDNELKIDKTYFSQYWTGRSVSLKKIIDFLDMDSNEVWLTCHSAQIFSTLVLRDMDLKLLNPRKIDYLDLIKVSPYEFSWYSYYLQKTGVHLRVREPYFKIFHTISQFGVHQKLGITTIDISRGYIGVVVNSNFQGNFGPIALDDNFYRTATHFLRYREILVILAFKIFNHLIKSLKMLTKFIKVGS